MNHLLAQQTVIVYRSKTEQMQDEAVAQLMQEHPEYFVWGFFFVVTVVVVMFISHIVKMRNFRR